MSAFLLDYLGMTVLFGLTVVCGFASAALTVYAELQGPRKVNDNEQP